MLLGEPPRTSADLRFSLLGIPVRIHPFFWLVGVILGAQNHDAREVLVWIAALFIAILVHELGHALVIRAYGFRPWITLYGMGGLASYDPTGSYRARGDDTLRQVLISFAGPGAGFLLAGAIVGGAKLAGRDLVKGLGGLWLIEFNYTEPLGPPLVAGLVWAVLYICLFWGAVNLLPVYPLDGGQITREVLVRLNPRDGIRQSLILTIITGALMTVYAVVQLESFLIAILFGYFAFAAYNTLQAYRDGYR